MDSIYNENPTQAAADHLATVIKEKLANKQRVLWLLSGGSGIDAALAASLQLQDIDLSNLYVTLTDERYGVIGHSDENWQQLLDGGLKLDGAQLYRPLTGDNIILTTDKFGAWLMQQMDSVDFVIGLFGIGGDGHTAGIKPHSPAVNTTAWAEHFTGEDYERITMTPFAISQVHEIVLQVSGSDKLDTIRTLLYAQKEVDDQPAQILKSVKKCTLYTNYEEI